MHIRLVTLFPDFFATPLQSGLMHKAVDKGILSFSLHNPRDYTKDPHKTVDDRPYGGGPGMVMLPEPLTAVLQDIGFVPTCGPVGGANGESIDESIDEPIDEQSGMPFSAQQHSSCPSGASVASTAAATSATSAISAVFMPSGAPGTPGAATATTAPTVSGLPQPGRLIYLSPRGVPLTQRLARELSQEKTLTLICGRYEGIDARIEEVFPVECVSVGDFILNGGETAALCLTEAVARLLPGYMGHEASGDAESFSDGLLEHSHYTRPEEFAGITVPAVLRSGDHARIAAWRRQEALAVTLDRRPDLFSQVPLTQSDCEYLQTVPVLRPGRNLYCALVHYPVLDKNKNSTAVSLTNLDIHDIARSSYTYGLGRYYIVTPIQDQQTLLAQILRHWTKGTGKESNPDRDTALSLVQGVGSIAEAASHIETLTGQMPTLVGTTAKLGKNVVSLSFSDVQVMLEQRPVLLLLGTGHGLAPQAEDMCEGFLPPLRRHSGYNHLSVRAAAAVIIDRILGDWR